MYKIIIYYMTGWVNELHKSPSARKYTHTCLHVIQTSTHIQIQTPTHPHTHTPTYTHTHTCIETNRRRPIDSHVFSGDQPTKHLLVFESGKRITAITMATHYWPIRRQLAEKTAIIRHSRADNSVVSSSSSSSSNAITPNSSRSRKPVRKEAL